MRHNRAKNMLLGALIAANFAYAQYGRGGGDWLAEGADAQRSGWVKNDPHISVESVQAGAMQSLWKIKLNGSPTAPVVASRLITYKGFKDLLFVGTSADNVVSIDHVLGKVFWESHLPYNSLLVPVKNSTANCPAGMTASLSLTAPAGPAPARTPGRGNAPTPPVPTLPRPKKIPAVVYALSSDGLIHTLNQHTGTDIGPAYRFIRGNAKAHGLIAVGNFVYAVTSDGCGGVSNGVWSINLEDTLVSEWKTGDRSVLGLAFGADDLFVTTSDGMAALDPKTLKVKKQEGGAFGTSPLAFKFKDKEYLATGGVHGHILVRDAASLAIVVNIPADGAKMLGSALASWEDAESKTRWILAVRGSTVVAFKIVEENGSIALRQEWTSREMVSPVPPIVVNGVVFALSAGSRTVPAVLYALDGSTGKELWSSGKSIAGYSTAGISAGASEVFVGTHDGTLYAFGHLLNRD
jgi:outer membrane protein assembly factor BamB